MALTDRTIAGLKAPASGRLEVSDQQNGLVVRVSPAGERVFGVWWRVPTKYGAAAAKGFITLAAWPDLSLAEARKRAAEIADIAGGGVDPREELRRRAEVRKRADDEAQALTVVRVVERHLAARLATLKPSTREQYDQTLKLIRSSAVADRPLGTITRGVVREALRAIYAERGPGAARKAKTMIRAAAKWAASEDLLQHDMLSGLAFAEAEPKIRDRVLADDEILKLWQACADAPPIMAASVRLQLVLALRHPSETTTMRWSDLRQSKVELTRAGRIGVDDVTVYEIPADRRKHGIPHSLPLPPLALEILNELRPLTGARDLVLDGWTRGRELHWWRRTIKGRLAAAGVQDVTRHDLRRTAASGMCRIGVSASAADVVLGHVLHGSARNYLHGARLVEAAGALWRWSDHLQRLIAPKKGAEVVKLEARK